MKKIDINTFIKIRIGLIWSWIVFTIITTFSTAVIYSEHKNIPARMAKVEKNQIHVCFAVQNIQNHLIPINERYQFECVDK